MSKIDEVIKCGDKLYYDINPESKMDVPSSFYRYLEKEFDKWSSEGRKKTFYEYCLYKVKNFNHETNL